MARFVSLFCTFAATLSCSVPPASAPRAVSRPGDPALDGNTHLLSETSFRAILVVVRAEIALNEPLLRVRRVHVVSPNEVEVYARDPYPYEGQENGGDNYFFSLRRSDSGWRITQSYPIVIVSDAGLTSRCSQPLAAPERISKMTSTFPMQIKLALASGG